MKNILLRVVLVCGFLFSCASESEKQIDEENTNSINVVTNRQATGSSANDLLSDAIYKKMVVEIGFINGFKPTETALKNLKTFVQNRTNKTQGIEFITKEIAATEKDVYTIEEIVDIEKQQRTIYNTSYTIAIWVLFVDGKSSKDSSSISILGSAYWNTSIVIYEEIIHNLSDSTFEPSRSLLESSVLNHEFAHILGLTNLGSDLQSDHEDAAHPKHCNEEDCLMYWAADSSEGLGSLFSEGEVPTLDAQCLTDLKGNGGK